MESLHSKLKKYSNTDFYPFHMPGHKRNMTLLDSRLPYDIDITEIDGFDNLHSANGILREVSDRLCRLFCSEHSYMLINGSTCGLLAAIKSVTAFGDDIIIARNCHKAVYNGCMLNNLNVHFVMPQQDSVSGVSCSIEPQAVMNAINATPNARAVVITSPTYEGVISDVAAIARVTHSRNIPLIVDNAHGAHQVFCNSAGEPISCGADIVISSLHKTLPSLTQTAAAFVNGRLVSAHRFEKWLSVFETSSPSYILMSSIDICLSFVENGSSCFEEYKKRLSDFSRNMEQLKHLTVLCHGSDSPANHDFYGFDLGKIVVCTGTSGIDGVGIMTLLRERYRLELEMAYTDYALAMTSVADTSEGFDRLAEALLEIDSSVTTPHNTTTVLPVPEALSSGMSIAQAMELTKEEAMKQGVSRGYIYAYPPGVPIVIPGERITDEVTSYIAALKGCGVTVNDENQ